jgi:hypothetical protein
VAGLGDLLSSTRIRFRGGGDELVRDANDSLAIKLAIAAIGIIVGALAVYTFARGRRAPTGLTENP